MKLVRVSASCSVPALAALEGDELFGLEGSAGNLLNLRIGKERLGHMSEARLLAPCVPRKIIGLAINYEGATGLSETTTEPLVFLKAATSVCGPGDDIVAPFSGASVWAEAEVAVVIGRRLRMASEQEAAAAILGYVPANDVTAGNIDGRDHHLARSKSADTFCPLGPWIDTEWSPRGKTVELYQDGKLIRRGNTDERLWQDARAVAWLSHWMTLEPWDVLLTGTPPRVVPRRFLSHGGESVVRIEGLGELRNHFKDAGLS